MPTDWPARARLHLAASEGDPIALKQLRDIALGAEPEPGPDHTITVEWGTHGGVDYAFRCHAGPESLCHAVYDCTCEEWTDGGVKDGKPYHTVMTYDDAYAEHEVRHVGRFEPDECNERDWFENSDECLRGKVTFPVVGEYESGGGMMFQAVS